MNLKIQYEPIHEKYAVQAMNLVFAAYHEERRAVPFLPEGKDFYDLVCESIKYLFKQGEGIATVCNNELFGFLCGFEVQDLFGKCKGIYSPIYGHGALKEHRRSLYQDLYFHAADIWVKKACVSHAITFFAHDTQTIDTWFWLGFGLRCIDAIREVTPLYNLRSCDIHTPAVIVKKADIAEVSNLANIHQLHHQYYRNSPVFMPKPDMEPVKDLTEWLDKDNHHLWVAYYEEEPLGYMKLEPTAETFIAEHPDVMNIKGAYVLEKGRRYGIGAALLGTIQQWLLENGYSLLGVDFEAINTVGSSFWLKYFTPYTYSLVRRIDERILV